MHCCWPNKFLKKLLTYIICVKGSVKINGKGSDSVAQLVQ